MTGFVRVGKQSDILGESPIWSVAEAALYWVDIRKPALRRLDPVTGDVQTRGLPNLVGAIALAGPSRLLVALGEEIALYDWTSARFETRARLAAIEGHRFNDGRCDRQGRFWVGTMHNVTRAPEGTLFRFDPPHVLVDFEGGVRIPNSLAWSPDGTRMYFADSLAYAIHVYDYDSATGTASNKRVFATLEAPAIADGATVDAEGFLWSAQFNAGRVVRYAPDGRIDRVLDTPAKKPTACAFGGPDLRTLYVTTASQFMSKAEMKAEPLAGALLACEPGVRGLPEPRWREKA